MVLGREYFRFALADSKPTGIWLIEELAEALPVECPSEAFKAIVYTPQFTTLNKPTSVAEEVQP